MTRYGRISIIGCFTALFLIQNSHSWTVVETIASVPQAKLKSLLDTPEASSLGSLMDTIAETVESVPDAVAGSLPGEPENSTQVCFERLGCFSMGNPWSSLLRPLPAPWSPNQILSSVTLFTREQPEGFHQHFNTSYTLDGSDFKTERSKTVFITHGFASNGDSSWLHDMKNAYLKNEDANIFILDWGKGASLINYLQVASNTRVVGAELARYIRFLIIQGLNTKHIHLIGHSLGSHIMSYCAKNISEISKVARITALDPAQPAFEGTPRKVRLDISDADNIDVHHTDAKPFIGFLGFGMLAPVGHVDFYFNGGSMQPGCIQVPTPNITSISDLLSYPVEVVSQWVGCSHGRSYEYFTEALRLKNCSFWGRKMSQTENFVKISTLGRLSLADPLVNALSQCTQDTCSVTGLHTFELPARGRFAVTTSGDTPYCETSDEESRHLKNFLTLGLYDIAPSVGKKLVDKVKTVTS